MNGDSRELDAMLDVLLPGDADFPKPSALGLAEKLLRHERFDAVTAAVASMLPGGFGGLGPETRSDAMKTLEAAYPTEFSAFLVAVYSLYYTHQSVLDAIERTSGYSARPPQPLGHLLAPFDPAMVATPAARKPHYRRIPGEGA